MYHHIIIISGIKFTAQPEDTVSCPNGTANFSCDYTGTQAFPIWLINSTRYLSFDLPLNTMYNGNSRQLQVTNVNTNQNFVTFQCSFQIFNATGLEICEVASSVGTLKVHSVGKLFHAI